MSQIHSHTLDTIDDSGFPTGHLATVKPASAKAVKHVLKQDENDPDGRSNWLWLRLQNGDLVLGVFPQGDTYFEWEHEAP